MFITSVPFVACLPWLLAADYSVCGPKVKMTFLFSFVLSLVDLLIAINDYDYSVSAHIREQYGMSFDGDEWFQSTRPKALRFQRQHCFM